MAQQIPLAATAIAAHAAAPGAIEVAQDVAYMRHVFVNTVMVGAAGRPGWVLVDTGLPGVAHRIRHAAAERFGPGNLPCAIVLTHGHFDHTGTVEQLAWEWNVPVFAHRLERPYLDGQASYPQADPTVGGGAMAILPPLSPGSPVRLGERLNDIENDGSIPVMPGWRALHTPGHSAGHISLWREADRTLIAGDAFITTAGESAYASVTQAPEVHKPPQSLTQDWDAAEHSVRLLSALRPETVITGHGRAWKGAPMRQALEALVLRFSAAGRPLDGQFPGAPRVVDTGSAHATR